jgi:hypothetical protein
MGVQSLAEDAFNLLTESMSSKASEAIRQELDRVLTSRPAGLLGRAVMPTVVLGASAGASVFKAPNRQQDHAARDGANSRVWQHPYYLRQSEPA